MTDQFLRPDGTGFYLAGGELTLTGPAEQAIAGGRLVDFSVTAGLFGGADIDVMVASWNTARTDDLGGVRSEVGRTILPLRTQPVVLNSLPSSVRVQLRTATELHDTEGAWQLVLHFRNDAGSSLTWQASLPAEAFGAAWLAPLADLLTIDGAVVDPAPAPPQSPTSAQGMETTSKPARPVVSVVHHPDDEYYEVLADGQQAGLLVYHVIGSHLSITHTVIDQTYRGRGLSWVLVGRALDDIRTKAVTVSNYCAVVRRFVEKNPEYRDLLSMPQPGHQSIGS
ncbi:GNAT family N-acetyltransferase [Kribbella sp. NPDC050470]|uniref:GNAT family N-acetyltransferase n=1 Tax=unclassified Kribbella TaxID=2644121 RepID=UPI00379DD4BC